MEGERENARKHKQPRSTDVDALQMHEGEQQTPSLPSSSAALWLQNPQKAFLSKQSF